MKLKNIPSIGGVFDNANGLHVKTPRNETSIIHGPIKVLDIRTVIDAKLNIKVITLSNSFRNTTFMTDFKRFWTSTDNFAPVRTLKRCPIINRTKSPIPTIFSTVAAECSVPKLKLKFT